MESFNVCGIIRSLLEPAIEMAESSKLYGESGQYAFIPVAIGFFFGAFFVFGADQLMHHFNLGTTNFLKGKLMLCSITTYCCVFLLKAF